MKNNNKLIRFVFGLLIIMNFISCEQEETSQYKTNPYTITGNVGLQYENITTYSYKEEMVSTSPQFSISNSAYAFSILAVRVNDTETVFGKSSIFSIDPKTGVISIDNSQGSLVNGDTYNFDIGIGNVDGVIRTDNAFVLTILETPLSYTISNTTFSANYLANVDVATVAYEDTSTNGDVLSDITYSLVNPPLGFSIDSITGVISKTSEASSGEHKISVTINSNLGSLSFTDVLTVTVGDAPIINYFQTDGITELSNVVLSPWTAYSTIIPVIDGMNAVSYEIILPTTLTAGSVIANSDGSISVLADQNLAIGVHSLGIIATNSSNISATFNDVFTLTVETRWETTPVFNEDFNNAIDPPQELNVYNPALNSYHLNGASTFGFQAAYTSSKGVYTAKLSEGKVDGGFATPVDAAMVLELIMQPEWRKMRVSFNEGFGFGDNRLGWYERTLQSSHSISDLLAANYDPSNWETVMSPTNTSWSGSSVWKTLSSDADLNQIPSKEVNITPGNASIFLNWRVQKTGTATGGAAFLIDDIKVEVSNAFTAEEQ